MKIIVPGGVIFDDPGIIRLIAEGQEGELEILPGHADFLTPLRVSLLEVIKQGHPRRVRIRWSTAGGILQAGKEGAVVISPAAERARDIDVSRAQAARERAIARLRATDSELDIARAQRALARAEVRLKAASFNQDSPEE